MLLGPLLSTDAAMELLFVPLLLAKLSSHASPKVGIVLRRGPLRLPTPPRVLGAISAHLGTNERFFGFTPTIGTNFSDIAPRVATSRAVDE
jgi:hypothetical protein